METPPEVTDPPLEERRQRPRLTDSRINAAIRDAETQGRHDLTDPAHPGLRLRVTPAGARRADGGAAWVLAMRDKEGRMRRFPLGAWPAVKIKDARKAAEALKEKVRGGADPIAEARRTRAIAKDAKEGVGTLRALLDLYGGPVRRPLPGDPEPKIKAIGPGTRLKAWADARKRIEHVMKAHLDKPIATLKADALQFAADAHPSPQSAAAGVRYLRPILKWAASRGYCPREAALIEPPAKVKQRTRVLSRDELKAILAACDGSDDAFRRGVLLLLWTACRRSEVFGGCWGDVNLTSGTWAFPVTKNGQPHTVPLPRQARAFLEAIKPEGVQPDVLVIGKRIANADRDLKRLHADSHTAGWSLHDLRRTVATTAGELGCAPHVIEMLLNHGVAHSAIAAIYNKHRYGAEVADALQLVADLLDGIRTDGAEVVALRPIG